MSKILVVDDDAETRFSVRAALAKAEHTITEAANGEEALSKALSDRPDLVIADVIMPLKDGYTLARELRSNSLTKAVPIIMLTALETEQDELRAFQDGVDDFVTKPFSLQLLRARVAAVLSRYRALPPEAGVTVPEIPITERIALGIAPLDAALGGGLPRGNNVLVVGQTGSGKSSLGRRFIAGGLKNSEHCMVITLDDEPLMIRRSLGSILPQPLEACEQNKIFCLVDAYSWSRGSVKSSERFAVSGILELNQLAGVISDASIEIGQTVGAKQGGRRLLDSISSLFINFDLASVQRFLTQLARTATSYGGVTSLFILEEGSVTEQVLNNIKYIVDGVIELKVEGGQYLARVATMKWSKFSRDWIKIEHSAG